MNAKKITATMTVTVSGEWFTHGKPTTPATIERMVRRALRDEFEFMADKVTVRRVRDGGTK